MQICGTQRGLWPGGGGRCSEGPWTGGLMFHRCCLEILSILTLKLCFVQSPRGQWSLCQGPGEQLCFQTSWDEFSACSYPQYLERGPLTASLHSGGGGLIPHWPSPQQGSGHRPREGQVRIPQLLGQGKVAATPTRPGLPGSRRGPQSTPWGPLAHPQRRDRFPSQT